MIEGLVSKLRAVDCGYQLLLDRQRRRRTSNRLFDVHG
jgi:hypothetical protein